MSTVAALHAIEDDAIGAKGVRVAWLATRHGEYVGWGSTPELAAQSAARVGMMKCDVEPAPWTSYWPVCRALRDRRWRTEKDLLEQLLVSALENLDPDGYPLDHVDEDAVHRRIDSIEVELAELNHPPSLFVADVTHGRASGA